MGKIQNLFLNRNARKWSTLWGSTYLYGLHMGVHFPPLPLPNPHSGYHLHPHAAVSGGTPHVPFPIVCWKAVVNMQHVQSFPHLATHGTGTAVPWEQNSVQSINLEISGEYTGVQVIGDEYRRWVPNYQLIIKWGGYPPRPGCQCIVFSANICVPPTPINLLLNCYCSTQVPPTDQPPNFPLTGHLQAFTRRSLIQKLNLISCRSGMNGYYHTLVVTQPTWDSTSGQADAPRSSQCRPWIKMYQLG